MSEQKSGTQYARDLCQTFREVASDTHFAELKEKLLSLADELEPIATKLYFKTPKGTEDLQKLALEMEELHRNLVACEEAAVAKDMCAPFYDKLEKLMRHAKTMKVRMT